MLVEAIVTEVDVDRGVCKCRTYTGGIVYNVQWLQPVGTGTNRGGSYSTPVLNERVVIAQLNGAVVIVGSKSSVIDTNLVNNLDIAEDWEREETGDYSVFRNGNQSLNGHAPSDMLVGDKIVASEGGSFLAALRGGSLLLKASNLAQIFVSKIDNIARFVSERFEHFTAIHSDYVVKKGKKGYRFVGYGRRTRDASQDRYKYYEITGDAEFGEATKGLYHDVTATTDESTSNPTDMIQYRVVAQFDEGSGDDASGYNEAAYKVMEEKQFINGNTEKIVRVADDSAKSTSKQEPQLQFLRTEAGADYAEVSATPTEIKIDWKGEAVITMNASTLTVDFKGNSKLTLNDSMAKVESNGHSITIQGSGVAIA